MRVAIYARVSRLGQEPDNQLYELRRDVAARGWEAVRSLNTACPARTTAGRSSISCWPTSVGGGSTPSSAAWERHFRTRSVPRINEHTQPGAQRTIWQILKTAPSSRLSAAERRAWLKMAFFSQLVAPSLQVSFIQYDLIVLEKT